MRQKKLLAGLVAAGAVVAAAGWLLFPAPAPVSVAGTADAASRSEARPAERPSSELASRALTDEPRGVLMVPLPLAPAPPAAAAPVAPAKPAAPPMPYRVAGKLLDASGGHILLAKGGDRAGDRAADRVFAVREGDILEDLYRVESIRADAVTLIYLPLGLPEDLPVTPLLAAPSPAPGAEAPPAPAAGAPPAAQVRWDGPASVQEGDTFDVALKLTSAQAVRSLPLQLSFDAKVLESVGVRAGSFFGAEGNFDYRVSPNGSILVGPSGTLDAASDAELVVLTFRPIRAGATTELTLSSFSLRGADGRAIALNHPPAFRVSIE